jgi:AcrR family transcriptional regulator
MRVTRKRNKQIESTRKDILFAAIPLLTKRDFASVSMEEIANAANVSRATLYNHFVDKAAILDAGFAEEFAAGCPNLLSHAMKIPSRRERLEFIFEAFAEWAKPKKAILTPVIAYGMRQSLTQSDQADPLQTFFVCALRNPVSTNLQEPDLEALAHYLRHQYLAATLRWLASVELDPHPFFLEMLALFLYGSESKRITI